MASLMLIFLTTNECHAEGFYQNMKPGVVQDHKMRKIIRPDSTFEKIQQIEISIETQMSTGEIHI